MVAVGVLGLALGLLIALEPPHAPPRGAGARSRRLERGLGWVLIIVATAVTLLAGITPMPVDTVERRTTPPATSTQRSPTRPQ